ncbi:MAG: M48 family metallopeptidase [Clostridia bacterium]|nr:M48 family metallopeptidase [Clostridia bacterium]
MNDIKIIYSARKTLSLEVSAEKGIILRAPRTAGKKEIERFLAAHEQWLQRAVQRVEQRAHKRPHYPESEEEIRALKALAAKKIPPRIAHYAPLLGVAPTKLGFTRAKTRFGSCSGKNALNFSCYLMLYSDSAVDYVVVHELCHIKYKNHSKQFYQMIESVMPDYRLREKELKGI